MLTMLQLKLFAICYPLCILLDMLWIGLIMRETYAKHIGHMLRISNGSIVVNWPAALGTWALMVLGAIVFVLPHVKHASLSEAAYWGGTYGLVLYGVYDLTNYALLAGWPLTIAVVDTLWGITLHTLLAVLLRTIYSVIN